MHELTNPGCKCLDKRRSKTEIYLKLCSAHFSFKCFIQVAINYPFIVTILYYYTISQNVMYYL